VVAATKRFLKILSGAALTLGFVIFAIDNRQPVTADFLLFSADIPLFLFAMTCFAFGAMTGGMVSGLGSMGVKRQHKKAKKHVMALENELKALHEERKEKLPAVSAKA
jgi:uncharacterized integral membrane protein